MSVPASLAASIGAWTGKTQLWLPGDPTRESVSTASVDLVIRGKFSTIAYTWVFEGEPQEGLLLIGHEPTQGSIPVIFADSWHMGDALMMCQGHIAADNSLNVRGSYSVEGGPEWGWRIIIEPSAAALRIMMYNILPEGEEMPGFEMTYTRSAETNP